ncbi:MAG: M20 family peptidase [Acidobacteria bacterium]|nr:MAG: M20 family peptidase [Acidobacteriota bacterium]
MSLRLVLDHESLFTTLADLVSINSVNPQYAGGPGEAALAAYVGDYLTRNDISFKLQPVFDGRPNVIARLEGRPGGRTLILEAHMDTASELGMSRKPFEPVREGNRMFGRGACDAKGGLAAMLHALKVLRDAKLQPKASVVLVAAVDEEFSFRGIAKFLENEVKADGAIVAEPTSLDIVIASKGVLRWRLRTHGRAAHSSKPHLGINAVAKMAKVIVAVEERFPPLFEKRRHQLVGSPTLNVGIISGGIQVNQVPDSCVIEIDRRLIAGETKESVRGEFESFLAELRAHDPELEVEVEAPTIEDYPLETPVTERIVQVVMGVSQEVAGRGRAIGVPYGSDASKLAKAGIPAVILGPGSIDQAHAAEEFVELDQVALAAEIYARAILEF